jgi:hypothetical protein
MVRGRHALSAGCAPSGPLRLHCFPVGHRPLAGPRVGDREDRFFAERASRRANPARG